MIHQEMIDDRAFEPGVIDDVQIADEVLARLREVSADVDFQVTVAQGSVTLEGVVRWPHLRQAAAEAVGDIPGIVEVRNRIAVKPSLRAEDVKARIERAFACRAAEQAGDIRIDLVDDKVVLRGQVHSWRDRDDAQRAASTMPGVVTVENNVIVNPW
jgi:osmotically-inducible protein OsmY